MRQYSKMLSVFLVVVLAAPATALSIPPPMSDEELVEKSDLAALVARTFGRLHKPHQG